MFERWEGGRLATVQVFPFNVQSLFKHPFQQIGEHAERFGGLCPICMNPWKVETLLSVSGLVILCSSTSYTYILESRMKKKRKSNCFILFQVGFLLSLYPYSFVKNSLMSSHSLSSYHGRFSQNLSCSVLVLSRDPHLSVQVLSNALA